MKYANYHFFVDALATSSNAGTTDNHAIPVLDPAAISNHPLTKLLLKGKLQNVKTERSFVGSNLRWNLLLEEINIAYSNILYLPYVCQTGLKEVSVNCEISYYIAIAMTLMFL